MTPADTLVPAGPLPPLRIPRALLDPRLDLPIADAEGLLTLQLEQSAGRLTGIRPLATAEPAPLALTPLVEPHAHLDKVFTAAAWPNPSGEMDTAMDANRREAAERTAEGVRQRAEQALDRAWRYGLRAIRSHVDSLGPWSEPSWQALVDLGRRWAGRVDLQLVALVPLAHWLTPEGEALAERVAVDRGLLGGVLGAPFPPSPLDQEALLALLRLADRFGCGVDLHVDESAGGGGRGVAMVSRLLLEQRLAVPFTCSHATSMAGLPDRACRRLAERLAAAAVAVVALPTTNLWLLDRQLGRTPLLRAQAPIRQLQQAGVTVAVGGDNVQDAWFPGGDLDPVALLRFAAVTSHLVPWERQGLAPFGAAAARLLALDWDGVLRIGGPADLIVLGAASWSELLARSPRRRVLRGGHWLPASEEERPSPLLPG
ncbi:MAG: amidohydrolase family protein [Cyanobacteriota bacterium]